MRSKNGGSFVTFLYVVNFHILSHKWPHISVNWHPPRAYCRKLSDFFCLRVDLNPQSQQRGRSFLCVTMFQGWHAREYLHRASEQQISRTSCAQTMISKFPKAWKLMVCLRLDVSFCLVFHIERFMFRKANVYWRTGLGNVPASEICILNPTKKTHSASEN